VERAHSPNSSTRPRTNRRDNASSNLPHFPSSWLCIPQLLPPRPSLAGCKGLCPPLLCHRQDDDVLAAPHHHPRRAVTSHSDWQPTFRAPATIDAPILARHTSWGRRCPCLLCPMGCQTLSPAVAPSSAGCQRPRPPCVHFGEQWPRITNGASTTRLEAATSVIAYHEALREELDMRRNSYDVDDFSARLRRVNGDVECDAATAMGCCVVVYARCPHIKAPCTPSLLFKEPPFPLSG
jgi:hypothetical protein